MQLAQRRRYNSIKTQLRATSAALIGYCILALMINGTSPTLAARQRCSESSYVATTSERVSSSIYRQISLNRHSDDQERRCPDDGPSTTGVQSMRSHTRGGSRVPNWGAALLSFPLLLPFTFYPLSSPPLPLYRRECGAI